MDLELLFEQMLAACREAKECYERTNKMFCEMVRSVPELETRWQQYCERNELSEQNELTEKAHKKKDNDEHVLQQEKSQEERLRELQIRDEEQRRGRNL